MSLSKAQKKRRKLMRTEGKDVTQFRGTTSFSTHERVTKSKTEKMEQQREKHKKHVTFDE